jgi:stage II sporulation protein E
MCEGLRGDDICGFRLYQCPHYRWTRLAQAGKDAAGCSGDNYDFIQLKGGKIAAVLSDGMGSGEEAARQSKSVTVLLRRMLGRYGYRGVHKDHEFRTGLEDPGESFATMDISIIDLYGGQAGFIKIAAQPTYLIRGGRIRSFRTNSLPVGILSILRFP